MALESATALAPREQELAGLKRQVLARLNHGIQTPRTGIPGRIDLLLQTALDGQETASQLQALVANSKS
jgi:K+-sensing histidine kinase KdpD